ILFPKALETESHCNNIDPPSHAPPIDPKWSAKSRRVISYRPADPSGRHADKFGWDRSPTQSPRNNGRRSSTLEQHFPGMANRFARNSQSQKDHSNPPAANRRRLRCYTPPERPDKNGPDRDAHSPDNPAPADRSRGKSQPYPDSSNTLAAHLPLPTG